MWGSSSPKAATRSARIINSQFTRRALLIPLLVTRPSTGGNRGRLVQFIVGLALIGATVLMVLVARPKDGESAHFLKSWPMGQAYALAAMTSAIFGVALVILHWPF